MIEKWGAWYTYGKERIGQGRENAKLYLKDHADLAAEVEAKVKEHLGVKAAAVAAAGGALAPDRRERGYRLGEVDRGRFASLPGDALEWLGLGVGAELTPAVLGRLRELADVEAAQRAALRALARRAPAWRDLERRPAKEQQPPAAGA